MGQYHIIVNLDKKQYLHPHRFGDGLKLLEFGCSKVTMAALAMLLANSNGRGGGDFNSDDPLIGSWAGDRIAIVGDYDDPDVLNYPTSTNDNPERNLYFCADQGELEDISERAMIAMAQDIRLKFYLITNRIYLRKDGTHTYVRRSMGNTPIDGVDGDDDLRDMYEHLPDKYKVFDVETLIEKANHTPA